MIPRPIHRWKSLWLGVLVMAFLGWAWWDSMSQYRTVACMRFSFGHAAGGVGVFYYPQGNLGVRTIVIPGAFNLIVRDGNFRGFGPAAAFPERPAVCPPLLVGGRSLQEPTVFVPHWAVMGVFAVAWGSLLEWRWRRMRRRTDTIA